MAKNHTGYVRMPDKDKYKYKEWDLKCYSLMSSRKAWQYFCGLDPPGVVPAYIHSDHKPAKAKHNNEYIIKTIFANTPPGHHLKWDM